MSKKNGTLFSSALFGYKKSDVNDYILRSDISHSDQLSLLQSENDRLLERAKTAEAKVEELEIIISLMEIESQTRIETLTREFETELKKASGKRGGVTSKVPDKGVGMLEKTARKHIGLWGIFKKK